MEPLTAVRGGAVPLTVLAVLGLAACDGRGDAAAIEVGDAWARPTPAGASTGAVYMTLRAGVDDELVGVGVDPAIAASGSAHETVSSDGQLSMAAAAGIALPAGVDVAFAPGGLHVMLEDLAAPLVAGDSFDLTLDFDFTTDLTVTVDVRGEAP